METKMKRSSALKRVEISLFLLLWLIIILSTFGPF
jgi:hypothetical protein